MIEGKYSNSRIYMRHSVRRYTCEPVTHEQIAHLLHAAMAAPSANNFQPWSFVVVDDKGLIGDIARLHPYAAMLRTASAAIVPCVERKAMQADPFYQQDLGACVENILLAAVECGLGTCWCGVHPKVELERAIGSLLKLPGAVIPFCVVAVGTVGDAPPPSDRYDASRVHRNFW